MLLFLMLCVIWFGLGGLLLSLVPVLETQMAKTMSESEVRQINESFAHPAVKTVVIMFGPLWWLFGIYMLVRTLIDEAVRSHRLRKMVRYSKYIRKHSNLFGISDDE